MKKSTKLISLLLAVLMIAALLPTAALADDVETASLTDSLGDVVGKINGIKIPSYVLYCSLMSKLPASHAVVTLTNNLTGETTTHNANMLGLAFISKSLIGVYTVAATCDGAITGIKYSSLPGATPMTLNAKVDFDKIVLFPVLNIGLNYTDHFAYMVGYKDGYVRPNNNITRAEVAVLIYRLMTPETRAKFASTTSTLSDLSASAWYNTEVCTLVKAGLISGYSDGTFRPNQNVTRAEFSAMIARLFSVSYTGGNKFEDLNGHWASSYMNLLNKLGILNGDAYGNANPDDLLTRAMTAAMLNRLVGRNSTSTSMDSCSGTVKNWPDISNSDWFYADILEATNAHNYTWTLDTTNALRGEFIVTEKWTSIRTDAPDWTK